MGEYIIAFLAALTKGDPLYFLCRFAFFDVICVNFEIIVLFINILYEAHFPPILRFISKRSEWPGQVQAQRTDCLLWQILKMPTLTFLFSNLKERLIINNDAINDSVN